MGLPGDETLPFRAGDWVSIPGQGTKIPHVMQCGKKKKKKRKVTPKV